MCKDLYNFDVEISSFLTVYVYISDDRVIARVRGGGRVTDGVQNVDPPEAHTFDGHYLRKRSTLDIGVLGYIGIV